MAKKRLKLKKKFKIGLIILISGIICCNIGINKYKEYKYHQTYEYKLLNIGYSLEEANLLQDQLDTNTLDLYLSKDKDPSLIKLLQEPYYLAKNFKKYIDYLETHSKSTTSDAVAIINTHRDIDYYEETYETDISKDYQMLINKYYYLKENYEPNDLVKISNSYSWGTDQRIKKEVYDAFLKMWEDANNNGIYLMINSSYRDYKSQKDVYDKYVLTKNPKYADSIAARPGHSEHSSGLCLDIFSKANTNKNTFKDTEDYEWLINNSYKYGFILRYPENKENITGYNFEAWHYRYVGLDAANYIYNHDITFDEYYAYFLDN